MNSPLHKAAPPYKGRGLHHVKTIATLLLFSIVFWGLLLYPKPVAAAVSRSLQSCLGVLVPSLFPFVVLSTFAAHSVVGKVLARLLGFVSTHLFHLPRAATTTILMGLVGGYPSGAAGVAALLKENQISKKRAGQMMLFCVNPGSAFVISYVGVQVLKSEKAGLLMFFAILLSSILLGVLLGRLSPMPKDHSFPLRDPAPGAMMRATQEGAKALLRMCACVLLFAALLAIAESSGLLAFLSHAGSRLFSLSVRDAKSLLLMLTEITAGIQNAAKANTHAALLTFGLAFGGLSVHMQVFSFFQTFPIEKWKYFLARFAHAGLSMVLYLGLAWHFPTANAVFLNTASQQAVRSDTLMPLTGGIALLLMCVAFLLLCRPMAPRFSQPKK